MLDLLGPSKGALAQRERRRKIAASRDENGKSDLVPKHGVFGSYTSGCRCRDCTRASTERMRDYYVTPDGAKSYSTQRYKRREEIRRWVAEIKGSWCADCGYLGPPEAMDFDHRPGESKVKCVSQMIIGRFSKRRIAAEILKCDLVCANCHRIRTAARMRAKAESESQLCQN